MFGRPLTVLVATVPLTEIVPVTRVTERAAVVPAGTEPGGETVGADPFDPLERPATPRRRRLGARPQSRQPT